METIEKSVEVDQPIRSVYNLWTQFESFPLFMEGVKSVRQVNEKRLIWHVEIAGIVKTWEADIVEQVPDTRIAWHSTSGATHAGVVTFHYLDDNKCTVTLQIEYEPEGFVENVGAALGIVESRMARDLERFKEFIEERRIPTGAWRGEVKR